MGKEPDGTIFLFDECQNDFPVRTGKDAPQYITQLAEHRRRGFDFYLITQHPLNIDAFVRRLIGAPGWHRHHKRASGAPMVSVLEWPSVNANCEKPGSGESGTINTVLFPREVYDWYDSATLHTAKTKIPFRVWVVLAAFLLAPLLGWYAYSRFTGSMVGRDAQLAKLAGKDSAAGSSSASAPGVRPSAVEKKLLTASEYAASYAPRIAGFPQSASRYDELARPTNFPRPAACLRGVRPGARVSVCKCWSQQATVIDVPDSLCKQIAAGGYFDDTLPLPRDTREGLATARSALQALPLTPEPSSLAVMDATPILPPPVVVSTVSRDSDVLSFMRKRQYKN